MATEGPTAQLACCLATTLDGKIAAANSAPNFTSRYDRHKLFRLRADADALLIGAGTVRQECLPPLIRDSEAIADRRAQGKPDHPAAVIVSKSLDLPWDSHYFQKPSQRLMVLTEQAPMALKQQLPQVEFVETGPAFSLRKGLEKLTAMGLTNILAEGGGTLVHALLTEELVDRFYLTIAPTFLGDPDAPQLVQGPVFSSPPTFQLVQVDQVGDELHLVYERPTS